MKCWFCGWNIENTVNHDMCEEFYNLAGKEVNHFPNGFYYQPYIPLFITKWNGPIQWMCPDCKVLNDVK
jgi:hypothetical protein